MNAPHPVERWYQKVETGIDVVSRVGGDGVGQVRRSLDRRVDRGPPSRSSPKKDCLYLSSPRFRKVLFFVVVAFELGLMREG
jgi:hypothetical protein